MKSPDKRIIIMDAAMELFKEKGYSNTRIIDIADRAGIGKGTVYAYFDSKEDLITQIIRDIVKTDFDYFMDNIDENSDFKSNIMKFMEISEKMIDKYGFYTTAFKEYMCYDKNVNFQEIMKLVGKMHKNQYMKINDIILKGIADGEIWDVEPKGATIFVMNTIGSYMLAKLMSQTVDNEGPLGDTSYSKVTKDKLLGFIMNGVCGKGKD